MKQSLKKIAFGFLALTFPCLGWSADIWAQWTTFEGLTSENPITPTTSKTFANQNAGTWKVYLGSGSVADGILTTGAEAPAYVDFNDSIFNAGRNGAPTSFLLEVELPIVGNVGQSKPLAHIGNGTTGYGFCLSDSQTVKGTWGNAYWSSTNNSGMTVSALATTETKTIWLACAAATTSDPVTTFAIDGSGTITKAISGLTGTDVAVSKIFLGNYDGGTANGLQYKLKSLTVYHGRVTEAELKNTIANLSLYYKATISENKAYLELEWTLDDEATTAKPTSIDGVELNVTQNATLTMDSETTIPLFSINGEGTLKVAGTFTATATNIETDVDVSNITASLGAVTIAEGATLTIGPNTTYTSIAGAGNITIPSGQTISLQSLETMNNTGIITVDGTVALESTSDSIQTDTHSAWGRLRGSGTLQFSGTNWYSIPSIATTLDVVNNITGTSGGIVIRSNNGTETTIGTLSGNGWFRSDIDSVNRTLKIVQSKNSEFSGSFKSYPLNHNGTANNRMMDVVVQGAEGATAKILTLSGASTYETNLNSLIVESTGSVKLASTGSWAGRVTVKGNGIIGGSGSIGEKLVFEANAILDVTTAGEILTAASVTLPEEGDMYVKVATLPEEGVPVDILTVALEASAEAILIDGEGNRCIARLETPEGGTTVQATRIGDFVTNPSISVGEHTTLSSYLNQSQDRIDPEQAGTLTITFTAENQTFTFDNELPLNFTSITVTGDYAGKVTMAEGDVVVETTATTIEVSADFTDANGMHFGAATIEANQRLTIDTDSQISSITGEGQLALAENAEITFTGATAHTGGTYLSEGSTLTISSNNALSTSGAITGSGTILCTSNCWPQNKTGLSDAANWTGTVSITSHTFGNQNLDAFCNANSTLILGNVGAHFNTASVKKLVLNGTFTIVNGYSTGNQIVQIGTLEGSGTLKGPTGTSFRATYYVGDASNFTGTIDLSDDNAVGTAVVFGEKGEDVTADFGNITIPAGETIPAGTTLKVYSSKAVEVYGTLAGTGTIAGELRLMSGATVAESTWTATSVTLPEAGYIILDDEVLVVDTPYTIATATTTATTVEVLDVTTDKYHLASVAVEDGKVVARVNETPALINTPNITVGESTSWFAFVESFGEGARLPSVAQPLVITFTEANQTFTFDNELPLSFTSITVMGEYAGKVTMAEGDVAVETAATTIVASADFTDANGMHFGDATINEGKTLTIDTDSQIRSVAGAGQLALAENAEITFSGATTHTGGTHLSEGATLTIKHTNSLSTAGAITGSGRLVIAGVTPVNKTGLNDATWTGVVEFTGALPAGCNFDDYGNNQSMVRLNGANGYTAQSAAGTEMAVDLELVAGGLTINNANSGQLAIVTGTLTGAGSLTMSATAGSGAKIAPRLIFAGDTTGFTGNIQVNSSETTRAPAVVFGTASNGNTASPFGLTLGDTNSIANYNPNGKIAVAPGATAAVVGTWTAAQGVDVYGTLGGSGKISSALTLNNGTTLVLGESPITVTGAVTVNGCLNVTAEAIATKTMKILATASTPTIADGATATLNGTACMLSAQADGLYVVVPGFDNYSDVTVQKLLAITGSKIPTTITGIKGTTVLEAADISASLELFENVTTTEDEGDKVHVQYNFGITSLKINAEGKVETVVSVETTAAPDTSGISQGVTVELYTIGANDTEVVLASMVLTAPKKTVTLITSQTYTEIMDALFPASAGGGSASSETLKVYVRAKKASLGEIVASAELDAATGTLISSHGQALDLYTFALADAIPAKGVITFNIDGVGAYEGQVYTLTIGETTYDSELSESGTVTFNLPTAVAAGTEATLAVANATGAIEVLETGAGPVRIQKLLARTPEEDLNPNYDPEDEATTCIFTPPEEGYRDMYRIPAIASDGNGEIIAIYDLRYIEGDLGQTTATNAKTSVDIAESYSTDGGLTWATFTNTVGENSIDSYVKIAIDVPNAYNFATIGGDTTIVTGRNAYSSLNGGNALSLADMDAGDPCIVYDKARNRYLAMVITGGGLVNAGNQDGGQNNGIALYSRAASKDAKWEPLHKKTVTTDSEHTISDNLTFETNALTALKAAYIKATGKELSSTKGYFQGPGHGMVTTQDVTDGEGNTIPAGTVVFPMQWFPQSGSSQAGALYSTDGENWKATSLTDYAGAQENCIVELDDGSWLMVAKYNNTGRGYTRTTDFLTWSPVQLKSPARLVQGSIIKIGENGEGKSRYAMITATEGSTGNYTRLNVRIFFATDATDDPTNASGIVWDPDTTAIALCPGNTGGQSYNSICLLEEGVIGVLYEANKHIYFERIDVRNRLD